MLWSQQPMKQASHSKSPIHFHTELKAGPQVTQGVKKRELWLDLGLKQNNHTF